MHFIKRWSLQTTANSCAGIASADVLDNGKIQSYTFNLGGIASLFYYKSASFKTEVPTEFSASPFLPFADPSTSNHFNRCRYRNSYDLVGKIHLRV